MTPDSPTLDGSDLDPETDVAIIGLACRLPGATDERAFWQNLRAGTESVTRIFDPWTGELRRAGGMVADLERFDARFFGLGDRDADLLDPQQRMFFEACWSALECAGYAGRTRETEIGVFGGMGHSTYLLNNVWPSLANDRDRPMTDSAADMRALISCDKDFLTGRAAYLLDLRGPAVTVQAACATGLFAVHLAVHALLAGECQVALAGAANASVPQTGLPGLEDGTYVSRDGYTRTFDSGASGAVFGSGCGVVALKLLGDALADGDPIRAVVKGSATNNDGQVKTGLTAPSARAQRAVIEDALRMARVSPAELGMVEAHGTATPVGDPVEVDALTEALRGAPPGSVALTAVKPAIGHLGWAAGIAGLIKAVLCLEHGEIPAVLNYTETNPEIDFGNSPLSVVTTLRPWPAGERSRYAGVSSFGVTGFNAHVVLREAPQRVPAPRSRRPSQILPVSAKSAPALDRATAAWADAVAVGTSLEDLAFTSAVRRPHHALRRAVIGPDAETIARALRDRVGEPPRPRRTAPHRLVQLFTGYVPQLHGLARPLLAAEPFREVLEEARGSLRAEAGITLEDILLATAGNTAVDSLVTLHSCQFVLQVALHELWKSWGVRPAMVVGHSLGEFAAAYAAGVFDLATGVHLVATRARLYEKMPDDGAMAVLHASAEEVSAHCAVQPPGTVAVAAVNGPTNVVVAGPREHVCRVSDAVHAAGRRVKVLDFGRAGHSPQVDGVLEEFGAALAEVRLSAPTGPVFVSNVTGRAETDEVATPEYWQRQMRLPVRFSDSLAWTLAEGATGFVELGPAPVLSGLVLANDPDFAGPVAASLRGDLEPWQQLLTAVGELYEHGVDPDWPNIAASGGGRAVPAPTYAFDRQRHWIDSPRGSADDVSPERELLYRTAWRVGPPLPDSPASLAGRHYLVVADREGVAARLVDALDAAGSLCTVADAQPDTAWETAYRVVRGTSRATLLAALRESDVPYSGVVVASSLDVVTDTVETALFGVTEVLQALTELDCPLPCLLLTRGGADTGDGSPATDPAQGAVAGLARAAAVENPALEICHVDLDADHASDLLAIADALTVEDEAELAYRGGARRYRRITRVPMPEATNEELDSAATYLVTGGLGTLGLLTAEALVEQGAKDIVLVGRHNPTPEAAERVDRLGTRAAVTVCRADVADRAQVNALLAAINARGRRVDGVVHCAGVIDDITVAAMDVDHLRTVFAGKARGAWHLHDALADTPLRFFTCFSSAASFVGNGGQANYAAANAYLDALVAHRVAQGLHGLSLAWGAWADVGHLAEHADLMATLRTRGMNPLPHFTAKGLLAELVTSATGVLGVIAYDWHTWSANLGRRPFACHAELLAEPALRPEQPSKSQPSDVPDLCGMDEAAVRTLVTAEVREAIAEALGAPPAEQRAQSASLVELGLDSFSAIQFRARLTRRLGVTVSLARLVSLTSLDDVIDVVTELALAAR
ncbi:type I polyketide synthase [Gandjariella thermophila]|uniref:Uncharacterized protein n=1 Tax=Gandjariella thermophila TaxID=1931992 RepID=A0A4D4JDW2_9PSEU|nr:type I polyketide synthase [Gandjariella thermophila]GDY33814.1 hypothetical protein GTS_54470 [Gandjariella thermophila]